MNKDTIIDMLVTLKQEHGELCDTIHDQWLVDNVTAEHLATLDEQATKKREEIAHYERVLAQM